MTSYLGETIQVGMVTSDLRLGLDPLVRLGIGPFTIFTVGPENAVDMVYRGEPGRFSMRLALATAGSMMWEVIEPLRGPSIYSEFLEAGHEGLHHVAVDGRGIPYEERKAQLERHGYEHLMGARAFDGVAPFDYFHSGEPSAPIIEVFEFPEGFAPAPEEWYPQPPPVVS